MAFHISLDGRGDVKQPVAFLCELDSLEETLPGHIDQVLRLVRNLSASESRRAVPVESSDIRSHIHTDDVALLQHPFAGDAVDDLVVDADAGAGRIAVIMKEGGDGALFADEMLHFAVDLLGCYAGSYHFPCQGTGSRGNFSGPAHQFDLVGGFKCDHALISPARGG